MDRSPAADLAAVRAAHGDLLDDLSALRDRDVRDASLLPGWTAGHVLTHLARNADAIRNMFEGAARGEVWDMYPGGGAQRDGDIAAGAERPAAEIVRDLGDAIEALDSAWQSTAPDVWQTGQGRTRDGRLVPLANWPFLRWREVEVHHHDLGRAFTWRDWSETYVNRELGLAIDGLGARIGSDALALRSTDSHDVWTIPENVCSVVEVRAPRRQLLAWLLDRYDDVRYPPIAPWG